MKKFYLIALLFVCLVTACGDATSGSADPSAYIEADDLEIVTLTESSRGDSLYLDVVVKNNSDAVMASASVQLSLLNGARVVDDGGAFYEDIEPGQEVTQKAAFYDVLTNPGSYTCYRYKVTVSPGEGEDGEDLSATKDYDGTCN